MKNYYKFLIIQKLIFMDENHNLLIVSIDYFIKKRQFFVLLV